VGRSKLEEKFAYYLDLFGVAGAVVEFPFAKEQGRRFRFDFAWPEERVFVELEGGTWVSGRHVRGAGFASDLEKLNLATSLGWRGLRFTGDMLNENPAGCIDSLIELLEMVRSGRKTTEPHAVSLEEAEDDAKYVCSA
jgi:very-short-patch-repair endonuclease